MRGDTSLVGYGILLPSWEKVAAERTDEGAPMPGIMPNDSDGERRAEAARRRAKRLRRSPTHAETVLWKLLRDRRLAGFKFRRQVAIDRFVVDFVCYACMLVVEADGGIHVLKEAEDAARDVELARRGFRVLRIDNGTIISDPELTVRIVLHHCRDED